jgi:outer membrane protein OmpA-like peptidoglycan-associated protein
MDNLQYVMGDFEGYFFTLQKSPLTNNELSFTSGLHNVNLYKGELTSVKAIDFYKPEEHLNRDGLILHNVTNVQLYPGATSPLNEKRIYDFQQVVLKNVEVVNSWEHNDKTYGILKGKLVGKLDKLSSIPNIIDPSKPNIPPPPIGGITNPRPPIEGGNKWMPPILENSNNKGCSWVWNLLKWLLLLLLIILLFRSCNSCNNIFTHDINNDSLYIKLNDSLSNEILKLQRNIRDNDSICEKKLEQEKIQNELNNLSSQIFFYAGTTNIREYSMDEINHIVEILNKFPSLYLQIQGYYNGANPTPINLDLDRANRVKQILIDEGIQDDRLSTIGLGNSKPIVSEDYLEQDPFGNKYNKNMRVELFIIRY